MRVTDMKTKNGTVAMQWFLSPEGKMFRGRKSTLEHITKCPGYRTKAPLNMREEDLSKYLLEIHRERIQRWEAPLIHTDLSSILSS